MSSGAPMRRPDKPDQPAERGEAVEVQRTEGGTVLGVVTAVHKVLDTRNICVDTGDGELVTVDERVNVVSGVTEAEARQKVNGGVND